MTFGAVSLAPKIGARQDRRPQGDLLGVLSDSLTSAFDRLDAFLQVQGPEISLEAVELLQEAAGVTASERGVIAERVDALHPRDAAPHTGAVLLGVLVGLFAAQSEPT